MFFDNLNIGGSTNKTADLIRAAVDLIDDLWKKSHPVLKRTSIGIQIKFSNLVEEISDDKHMELEEKMVMMGIMAIQFWCIANIKTIEGLPSHNSANEPTTTSTSDREENEKKNALKENLLLLHLKKNKKHKSTSSNIKLLIEEDGSTQIKTPRSRTKAVIAQIMSSRSTMNTSQLSGDKRKSTILTALWKKQPKVSEES
ncbi:14323_t:CDS:2 [Dentiscutata erythropus]|uniref:14323_t:CDS:1 n=1 Tax=Dentiscutata erythropus TaxID=1348616 RepID=A0A9N9NJJ7_9GLOM|nr:14323_t:CDS:2 [Dentiscutata erythropus]